MSSLVPDMAIRRRAITDPTRMRVVRVMSYEGGAERTWTAKQLADALSVKANGLHYHLRILEEAQFIDRAGTTPGPRGPEQAFRSDPAKGIVQWDTDHPEELLALRHGLLELAKIDVEDATHDTGDRVLQCIAPAITTTHAEAEAFRTELANLVSRFRERAGEALTDAVEPVSLRFTFALTEHVLAPS